MFFKARIFCRGMAALTGECVFRTAAGTASMLKRDIRRGLPEN
jgi:hypothetical protein